MCEGRPEIALDDVQNWAAKFGLCSKKGEGEDLASVKDLPAYEDLNYHIKTQDGREYVLKAHNGFLPSGTMARCLAQNRLIDRLESKGLPVPSVVKTPDGNTVLPMAGPEASEANQKAHMRVLTWVKGDIVPNDTPKSASFLATAGNIAGKVTHALAGYEDEDAKWDWDWNMKNVVSACSSRTSYVTNPTHQALAEQFIESYKTALNAEATASLPHSVIHADLNDTNLLFEGESVVGVIDFGDSIYSCTVFELGIAAGYYSLGQEDPLWVFCEILRGYLQEADLSDQELDVLYHVCYGRVLLSVCMSAQSCAAEPDNEYLAHTSEPGWAVLTKLADVTAEEAASRFRAIRNEVRASVMSNGKLPGKDDDAGAAAADEKEAADKAPAEEAATEEAAAEAAAAEAAVAKAAEADSAAAQTAAKAAEDKPAPATALAAAAGSKYSLEELQNGCPEGVPPSQKEDFLNDDDFQTAFKHSRADFEKLPKWKKDAAKKAAKIF